MSWIAGRCASLLDHCIEVLERLGAEDYSRPVEVLDGSSVGMHFRHVIEFFGCLFQPEVTHVGVAKVCYDRRERDLRIEADLEYALGLSRGLANRLREGVSQTRLELLMETDQGTPISVETNLERELAYNLEHLVHHMALMRIGVKSLQPGFSISSHFGLADSTRRHRNLSA
ncbi:hypothetical protein GC167_02095 [bacterium]|nr:hypothetical protein [bacterium]